MKVLWLAILFIPLCGISQLEERLSLGAGFTANSSLIISSAESYNIQGINLRLAANVFNHQILVIGYSRYLPVNATFTATATNKNTGANNYLTDFKYNDRISTSELFAEICNIIGKDNTDHFGFYFHTGLNCMFLKEKLNYIDLDTLNFRCEIKEGKYSSANVNLYFGFGMQFRIKEHIIFIEPKADIPVLNGRSPNFYRRIWFAGFTLGYRYSFEDY